jgi:acyl-CoA synthetase (AMP-forming)/AMP-acid ligase II
MSAGWNWADVWEVVAEERGGEPALVHGEVRRSWAELDRRADGLARTLLEAGFGHQDKVAQYLHNCNEYLESLYGTVKAGLVPVNTNYRYVDDELVYLWDNADAVAVVFHGTFAERIDRVRERVPRVRLWLWVDDGSGPCPDWAVPYEEAAAAADGRTSPPWGRSGDDLYILYTGGTTGMPKGVMWRQDDLYRIFSQATLHDPDEPDLDAVRTRLRAAGPGPVAMPVCPLMHGTGALSTFQTMFLGGCIVTLPNRSFDPVATLEAVQRERVNAISIVGDAFAKPMLAALDAEPGRFDLSSLALVISSGVMWSEETKRGLLRHNPGMLLYDSLGSSEAIGMAESLAAPGAEVRTATFRLGPNAKVLDDDLKEVVPGSGQVGRVAVGGHVPIGYYKDPEKSARTFPVIDGVRYSIPGDYATVDADGTVRLLGRGSNCINTAGEKVYPEEVEEAVKTHPSVADAAVVGVPDERFGEAIVAVVEPAPGAELDEAAVIAHVKGRLAGYKAPKRVLAVESLGRAANGKVDYRRLRELAIGRL